MVILKFLSLRLWAGSLEPWRLQGVGKLEALSLSRATKGMWNVINLRGGR